MENDRLLNAQEVAFMIGKSIYTINNWYKWKNKNPNHELAKLLPEYIQQNATSTRYWKQEDLQKLIEFNNRIPKGKNGVMGEVTKKYVKKGN